MRAVTAEEVQKIAGGLTKKMHPKMRKMLAPPPGSSGGGGGSSGGGIPTGGGNGGVGYPTSGGGWKVIAPSQTSGSGYSSGGSPTSGTHEGSGGGGGTSQGAGAAENDVSFLNVGLHLTASYLMDTIFKHENSSGATYVPSVKSGHLTVGYGVDLHNLTKTTLTDCYDAGYISKTLYDELDTLLTATGATADADLAKDPGVTAVTNSAGTVIGYRFPASDAQGLTDLSEVRYGEIMTAVSASYIAATTNSRQADGITAPEHLDYLPASADNALTDVSIRWGNGGMQGLDGGVFWKDFTSYNWTGAEQALKDAAATAVAPGDHNRLEDDATALQSAIGNGLKNGYPNSW